MAPVDTSARTVAQSPTEARTQLSPSSASNRLVRDTAPLDPSAERYLRRSLLGAGGMGEVHLCRDAHIEREVAMKIARESADSNPDLRGRFIHEARVQGQLEHPSIVPVYDLGVRPDGAAFFTMKRVRGRTISEILGLLRAGDPDATQHFTRRRLLSAFSSVCMAVHFAHSRGVLHRDLKPSNVMLGDFGEVYVLDWGLAKVVGEPENVAGTQSAPAADEPPRSASGGQTVDGAILGTPGYMSPEQIRGRLDQIDARTDVYALGSMLFELLTLKPLHGQKSVADVIVSTLSGADARPSVRARGRDVPPELETMCVRATETEPADRYASAGELAAAVESFLDGDRDLELRRTLSSAHAHNAMEAAKRALASGTDAAADHALAMREVGRALAMNPDNPDAMRTLVELLSHAPAKLPAEAIATVDADRRKLQQEGGFLGGMAYVSWLLYVPIAIWMGLRNLTLGLVLLGSAMLSGALSFRLVRHPTRDGRVPYPLLFAAFGSVALFSFMFGPFILVSGMAAVSATAFILGAGRLHRRTTIALACLATLLPAALEWIGVWPHSYAITHEGMLVLPRLLRFTRPATEIFLGVTNTAFVITTAFLATRFRDVLSAAEEKLHFHAWQLRQLMPPAGPEAKAPVP